MNTTTFAWAQAPAVLNTLNQYAWGYDSGDMQLMGAAFAEQGFTAGVGASPASSWGPWRSRQAIIDGLGAIFEVQNDRRRHQITTPMFLELSDETALVKTALTVFATEPGGQPGLVTTGEYLARLSCVEGGWLIDSLEVVLDGDF